MEIGVTNINFIYEFLLNPPIDVDDESWKDQDIDSEITRRHIPFRLNRAPIPEPLSNIGGVILRQGDNYSGLLFVEPSESRYYFEGVSDKIREIVSGESNGTIWAPTSPYGAGYFYRANGEASVSIVPKQDYSSSVRIVCVGTGGTIPRKFEREDIVIGLGELCKGASRLVQACLDVETLEIFGQKKIYLSG